MSLNAPPQPVMPQEATDRNVPAVPRGASHPPLRRRLRQALLPIYKPSRSRILPGLGAYLMMRPALFEGWYRGRAWWFRLARGPVRAAPGFEEPREESLLHRVFSYNRSQMWEFYRVRTEKLMAVLRCLDAVPRDARILVIGPRNEAEMLLLSLYGFPLRNQVGLDLFSYSPRVQTGDMHALPFPDGSFDVVYSAWTLKYSYDIDRAVAEIVRVVRPGGHVVTGFSHTHTVTDVIGSPLERGLDGLLQLFGRHVDEVNWRESAPVPGGEEVSIIFRVRK